MYALWESELRFFLAPIVFIACLVLLVKGSRQSFATLRLSALAKGKNLLLMRGFRLTIFGLAWLPWCWDG